MGKHPNHRKNPSGRLMISILLNGFITLVEIVVNPVLCSSLQLLAYSSTSFP
jgi:Co/Zn/Cd efflux system component